MSKKIEEVFNMASTETEEDHVPFVTDDETGFDLSRLQDTLDHADKIDQALPAVRDLETHDRDMDKYAEEAMDSFKDLMDLGQNVEDRNAAAIFDVASKMMSNAITAKQAKLDKKLKMIELQMRKRKLDMEERKLEHQIAKDNASGNDGAFEGEAEEIIDRNELLNSVLASMKSQNSDK